MCMIKTWYNYEFIIIYITCIEELRYLSETDCVANVIQYRERGALAQFPLPSGIELPCLSSPKLRFCTKHLVKQFC